MKFDFWRGGKGINEIFSWKLIYFSNYSFDNWGIRLEILKGNLQKIINLDSLRISIFKLII